MIKSKDDLSCSYIRYSLVLSVWTPHFSKVPRTEPANGGNMIILYHILNFFQKNECKNCSGLIIKLSWAQILASNVPAPKSEQLFVTLNINKFLFKNCLATNKISAQSANGCVHLEEVLPL